MTERKLGLDDAYAVETPDDNRRLYRDWAESYDRDFIEPNGYVYHLGVVSHHADRAGNRSGPVLDVGCGTGVVGVALIEAGFTAVDGIDLSPEMLDRARSKRVYRSLIEADLTDRAPLDDGVYAGVVSVGAFTHGHLPPEPLLELLRVSAPGAHFTLGVNAEHYAGRDFEAFLATQVAAGAISEPELAQVRIYTTSDGPHADDLATVVMFTKR